MRLTPAEVVALKAEIDARGISSVLGDLGFSEPTLFRALAEQNLIRAHATAVKNHLARRSENPEPTNAA